MKLRSKIFYTYAIFVIIYVLLVFLPAPAKATLSKYHLQATSLRLLDLTLLIPILIMWFAIFYGYSKLHDYSQLIKGNRDSKPVATLAGGLLALAIGVPAESIVSNSLTLIAQHHHSFTTASTITSNYIGVFYPLIAFFLIAGAARSLSELAKTRPGPGSANVVALVVIALGVIFCDLIARSHRNILTTYHMPYSLVMLTFAIPYMYTWFLGLFSIAELYVYSKQIAGVIYRRGWNRLMFGLGAIIIIDILLQYLGTLSSWLNGLSLGGLLLVLYVLLIALAAGFIVVALGTKELMKIEKA